MRIVRQALAGIVAAVATVAVVSTVAGRAVADDIDPGTMEAPMGMDMTTTGTACAWGVSLSISVQDNRFDRDCLAAPPGERFTITFENNDATAHNLAILPDHEAPELLFRGGTITGPSSTTYTVGPLAMGRYHFHCETHPTSMTGTFAVGGPTAFMSPGGMAMSPPPAAATYSKAASKPVRDGASSTRTSALAVGIGLLCAGGLFLTSRSRRRPGRAAAQTQPLDPSPSAGASDANVGRRQLVKLGTAGVAGAALAKLATSTSAAGAEGRLGGIHISVLTEGVNPEAVKGVPHHWALTVHGPDNALNGMGWGGATDLKTAQDVLNSKMFPCIYSLTGKVEGDLVKLHGLMLFSGAPDQGLPLTFEANLTTGALHVNAYGAADFEGTGVVARI